MKCVKDVYINEDLTVEPAADLRFRLYSNIRQTTQKLSNFAEVISEKTEINGMFHCLLVATLLYPCHSM